MLLKLMVLWRNLAETTYSLHMHQSHPIQKHHPFSPCKLYFYLYRSTILNLYKCTTMNLFKRAGHTQHVCLIKEEHDRIKKEVRKHANIVLYINQPGSGGCESQINTSIERVLAFTVSAYQKLSFEMIKVDASYL